MKECQSCNSTCLTCDVSIFNISSNASCLSCPDGTFLNEKQCGTTCPSNKYKAGPPENACNLCDPTCLTCEGEGPNYCLTCNTCNLKIYFEININFKSWFQIILEKFLSDAVSKLLCYLELCHLGRHCSDFWTNYQCDFWRQKLLCCLSFEFIPLGRKDPRARSFSRNYLPRSPWSILIIFNWFSGLRWAK